MPQRTARHLIKRFRNRGEAAVPPADRPKGHDADPGGDLARLAALAPRGEHPPWGAPLIRSLLLCDHPASAVPSPRSLQRLIRRQGLARPPRPERPTPTRRRPERPHEAWQVDASEAIPIATGEQVCWPRVVNEPTGAVLLTRVFPRGAMDERPGRADRRGAATGLRAEMRRRLAEYAVVRQINSRGLISVYGRNHYVGKRNAGRSAYVRLDVESGDWLFELTDGPTIGRTPAGLSRETILSRQVTARHPHSGKTPVASGGTS